MIDTSFLLAGKSEFEVINPAGQMYRYTIYRNKKKDRFGELNEDVFFVRCTKDSLKRFSNVYMGHFNAKHHINPLKKGQNGTDEDEQVTKVFKWAVQRISREDELPDGYVIRHTGKCGCCGRKLTDDYSRAIGLGSTCAKRYKLSFKQLKLKLLFEIG
jgi:hypothetical protein